MRNRVREQRTQRGLSQAELAAALGVSRQTVISIEGGRYLPSLPLAFTIARFFDHDGRQDVRPRWRGGRHMMTFIRPRLRKPLRNALAGTVFAAAWALRGGNAWQLAIVAEVTVLVSAITMYVRAGEDNDEGALAGSRADERQKLLSLRSRALG